MGSKLNEENREKNVAVALSSNEDPSITFPASTFLLEFSKFEKSK